MKRNIIASFGLLVALGISTAVILFSGKSAPDDASSTILDLDSLNPKAPVALCFKRGTDPEFVEEVHHALLEIWGHNPNAFNVVNRWSGTQGSPRTLTWSIPNDGLFIPNGIGEGGGSNVVNAMLAEAFGSVANGKNLIRQAFASWEDQTGLTFIEVSDDNASWGASGNANRGDIRISAKNFGFGGVLAYNSFPSGGGDMVINEWHEFDFDNPAANFRFFRNTFAHENGHGIGIAHVCSNFAFLLEPFIQTNIDMVQHDDLQAAQRHYGDHLENNNFISQATYLGDINGAETVGFDDISIDDDVDVDWFSFTVDANTAVTVTASPVGFTYGNWDQNANGSCPGSGPTRNSRNIHDLRIELYDTNGTSLLDSSNTAGEGSPEVLGPYTLPGAGTYFAVIEGDNSNDIQIYDLIVDFEVVANAATVSADMLTVDRGNQTGGTLADTFESDDSYVSFVPGLTLDAEEAPVRLIFDGTLPSDSPNTLDLVLESSAVTAGMFSTTLEAWNWNTNEYDVVDVSDASVGSDTVTTVDLTSDYVQSGTGAVRSRVGWKLTGFAAQFPWEVQLDQLVWKVNQ